METDAKWVHFITCNAAINFFKIVKEKTFSYRKHLGASQILLLAYVISLAQIDFYGN